MAVILNNGISPARPYSITADNRAILHGIAQNYVVVIPTLDPDSMVGLTHSGAATPLTRTRRHDQIPKRGQASINPRNTSLSPNIDPGHKVDKHVLPTSNVIL